jgi:ABC-type cobalamin/Fe3+-siderophores transport system ATPase subunit
MTTPILKLRNISASYGRRTILDNLCAEVREGEIIALLGPNGCGKSTLLKTILGLVSRKTGTVHIAGRHCAEWKRRELASFMSYLPQAAHSYWDLSVEAVIHLGLTPATTSHQSIPQVDWQALRSTYELDDLWQRRFHSLSGGEKARVMLAMCMMRGPRILLADEPTASLDISHAIHVLELLKLQKHKTTVLLVIHDLNLAISFADRIWLLDHGKIVLDGDPEVVMRDPLLDQVFRHTFHRHSCSGRLVLVPTNEIHTQRHCEFSEN